MAQTEDPNNQAPLKEGLDYYIEGGYWVFTEHYLLRRGSCCKNGCRHCPYRKKRNTDNRDKERNQ